MAQTLSVQRDNNGEQQVANKATTASRSKRYSLVVPEDLYQEVERLADQQHTTVVELLRRFIKLGLLATRVQESPGGAIIMREGNIERELIFL